MRAASLDQRVCREARLLVRDARAALVVQRALAGRDELAQLVRTVDAALAARDVRALRGYLPELDARVDAVARPTPRSQLKDYAESILVAFVIAFGLRVGVLEAFKIPSSSMYPTLEINDHIFVNKLLYGIRLPLVARPLVTWHKPQRGEVIVFIMPCQPDLDYIKRVIATEGQTVEVRCNVVYVDGQPIDSELVNAQCSYDNLDDAQQWSRETCSEYVEHVDGHTYHTFHDPGRPRRDQRARNGTLTTGDQFDFPLPGRSEPPSCLAHNGKPSGTHNQLTGKLELTPHHAGACAPQAHYVVPPGHVFVMGDNRSNSNDSRYWGAVPIENVKGKASLIWLAYSKIELQLKLWKSRIQLKPKRIGSFVP